MKQTSRSSRGLSGPRPRFRWGAWAAAGLAGILIAASESPVSADDEPAHRASKWRDFNEVVRGTERFEGLFNLYRTNDTLYASIKPG